MNLLQQLFGQRQQTQQQQQGPVQGQQQQQQQAVQQFQQQQLPAEPGNFPTQGNELDALALLLQNDNSPQSAEFRPFSLPQEQLSAATNKLNFTQNLSPEILQGLQSGDMNAVMAALNHVGQQSYLHSMQHNMALTNQYIGDRFKHERQGINDTLKLEMRAGSVKGLDKLHPLAQDMFKRAQQQLISKFPNASQSEIEETVWTLMGSFGNQLNRDSSNNPLATKPLLADDIDWDLAGGFAPESGSAGPTGAA